MRRIATWLLVGAVAALGVAALVDALRGDVEPVREARPPEATTTTPGLTGQTGPAAARLRDAEITGVLTYADDDCRLRAVSLPDLEPARAPSFEMCRPLTDSSGLGTVDGDVVWAGLGYGAVQVVVSRETLGRAISRWLAGPGAERRGPFRAVQAVGLGPDRLVVLADSTVDPTERVLVLVEHGRVIFVQPRWVVREARFIRPSPLGTYFALFGPDGVRLFDRNAGPLALPAAAREPQAVAWSPDERWTALATEDAVYVFPSEAPYDPMVRVPLAVRDLDWGGAERGS
ncbi:MAG TPA: hypothetical protein VJ744_07775 [Gaiellaceae bacterium]|nr:hypothetical protein [Gaiellaceae bacterium]